MTVEWWADLVPATCLAAMAAIARHQQGAWLAPGAFFCLVWALLVWIALIVAPDVDVWSPAIWWITMSAAAVFVGSALGISGGRRARRSIGRGLAQWPGLGALITVFSLCGFAAVGVILQSRGLGIQAVASPQNLADVAREYSVARYEEGYREPLVANLLLTGTYMAALLGGVLLATESAKVRRILALLPVFAAIAVAAVETTKATMYFVVILMTSSYCATRLTTSIDRPNFVTLNRVLKGTTMLTALALLSVVIQLSRYGYSLSNARQVDEVLTRLRIFGFGYLGAFAAWFHGHAGDTSNLTYGTASFAGVVEMIAVKDRPAGIYQEYVYLGASDIPTNVYTGFRMLIQDFGLPGSLLVLALVGFIAGRAYVGASQKNAGSIPILAANYATALWSPITGYFEYNSLLLAFLLLGGYVIVAHRRGARRSGYGRCAATYDYKGDDGAAASNTQPISETNVPVERLDSLERPSRDNTGTALPVGALDAKQPDSKRDRSSTGVGTS